MKTEPVTKLAVLQPTSDPETFARQTAEALFEWDTATIVSRTDHVEQLVSVADPTGESTPGLVADIGNYLPTQDAWAELTKYETRQRLVVDAVTMPTKWVEAVTQAGDQLLPGTTALTIHGTRHRSGVWEGEPAASEHDVAFTIFMVCGPSYPECHLLRLSMLDKPLE
ncbi:MAG: cell wall protein [Nocardioides sp.]